MKKPRKPGLVSDIEKEVGGTLKTAKEQVSPGNFFEEFLRQILGGVKQPSPERMKELKTEEDEMGRKARAKVLEQFMGSAPAKKERVYEKKQKEEAMRRMEQRKKVEKEAGMKIIEGPKAKTQRGSAFAFLKRKKTKTERKGGKF